MPKRTLRILLISAGIIGYIARIYLATAHPGNFDQESFEIVAEIMRSGENVYAETSRYNYSPIWAWFLLGLSYLPTSLHLATSGFLSLVDLANSTLIGSIIERTCPNKGYLAFLLYWLNPAAILIVGYHGQFETLAMLPLLSALYFARWGWLLATISLVIKHITMPGVWVINSYQTTSRLKGLLLMIASLGILILSFLPYLPEGREGIIDNVFLYAGISGFFGLTSFLPPQLVYGLFAGVMVVIPWIMKDYDIPMEKSMGIAFLAFIVFTPGIGQQYFLLVLLSGLTLKWPFYVLFSSGVTLWMLGDPNGLGLQFIPTRYNAVWIIASIWLVYSLRFLTKSTEKTSKLNPTSTVR